MNEKEKGLVVKFYSKLNVLFFVKKILVWFFWFFLISIIIFLNFLIFSYNNLYIYVNF